MGDAPPLSLEDEAYGGGPKIMKHIYEWLDEPAKNNEEKQAKEWLDKLTQPAYTKDKDGTDKWLNARKLTCEWKGKRYQCTGASRLGDVWLKEDGSNSFYDHRVDVEELSAWNVESIIDDQSD